MVRLSKRQKALSAICHALAGDRHEERTTNLLPEHMRIKGLRLWLYHFFTRLRFIEGDRLERTYNTNIFAK